MKKTTLHAALAAPVLLFAFALPSFADAPTPPTTCKDGTTSMATGRGACSGHGGQVKAAKTPAAAAPAAPATPAPMQPAGGAAPGSAPTTCKDGTTSSATGRGACSGHGGQVKAAKTPATAAAPSSSAAAPAAPAPTPPPAAAASPSSPAATSAAKTTSAPASAPTVAASHTDPAGATAKCKDGTYSKSQHHEGSCSHHGGVAAWLTAAQ